MPLGFYQSVYEKLEHIRSSDFTTTVKTLKVYKFIGKKYTSLMESVCETERRQVGDGERYKKVICPLASQFFWNKFTDHDLFCWLVAYTN